MPNFSIRDSGTDENRLPTASTCVNLLKVSGSAVLLHHEIKAISRSCRDTRAEGSFEKSCCKLSILALGSIFREVM